MGGSKLASLLYPTDLTSVMVEMKEACGNQA